VDPTRDPRSGARSALIARIAHWLRPPYAARIARWLRPPYAARIARWLRPPYAARIARWLRPPRALRPTRAGWIFFAITFGVGFAALNTGNNLLYLVLSLMLAFLVLSGLLSESALRGIQVRRRLPGELYAGVPGAIRLEISNNQRRVPAFAVLIEDRLRERGQAERAAGRAFALRIGPAAAETRVYSLEAGQRGRLAFTRCVVSTRFPFGLFAKSLVLERPEAVLAFPAPEPSAGRQQPVGDDGRSDIVAGENVDTAHTAGLRGWAPGDPARRVHWRASLRHRTLLVRELEKEHRAEIQVYLRTGDAQPGEAFERGVRSAAAEVIAGLESGCRVGLSTDATRIPADVGTRQRLRLLTFLALVEPGAIAASERTA
jgi:uncharacterized protein (DUF58 family)